MVYLKHIGLLLGLSRGPIKEKDISFLNDDTIIKELSDKVLCVNNYLIKKINFILKVFYVNPIDGSAIPIGFSLSLKTPQWLKEKVINLSKYYLKLIDIIFN